MDQDIPPHSNKKVILLAVGAVGLILIFLFITIFAVNSTVNDNVSNQPQAISENPTAEEQPANPNGETEPSVSVAPDGWKIYQNSAYSILYPSGWTPSELNLSGGVKGISLKPVASLINSSDAILTVTVNDPSAQKIRQSEQMYIKLGFKPSSININNTIASKLSGTIPAKTTSSIAGSKVVYTGYIILDNSGSSYLFDYSYVNSNNDAELENTMDKIISSFKLL